jgi:hypothetical protein
MEIYHCHRVETQLQLINIIIIIIIKEKVKNLSVTNQACDSSVKLSLLRYYIGK